MSLTVINASVTVFSTTAVGITGTATTTTPSVMNTTTTTGITVSELHTITYHQSV